jgi:hypothetical protein
MAKQDSQKPEWLIKIAKNQNGKTRYPKTRMAKQDSQKPEWLSKISKNQNG